MRAAAFTSGSRSRLNAVVVQAKESRIGSKPIVVPKGVTVDLKDNHLKVKVRAGVFCVCVCVWGAPSLPPPLSPSVPLCSSPIGGATNSSPTSPSE